MAQSGPGEAYSHQHDHGTINERQPLLTRSDRSGPRRGLCNTVTSCLPQIQVTEPRFRILPFLGCLIVLLGDGEYYFKQVGYWRALEALYCIDYYRSEDPDIARLGRKIPEHMCKLAPIEKKVATANGIVMLVRFVACFVGTMPLGYFADKLGRRFALVMHKVGTTYYTILVLAMYYGYPTVPIWVSFLGGLGGLIGANIDLNLAIMLASYTDSMTSATQRETCFYITSSMQYVAQVAWPLVAGIAINMDGQGGTPEISLLISLAMSVLGLLVSAAWPETLENSRPELIFPDEAEDSTCVKRRDTLTSQVKQKVRRLWTDFRQNIRKVGLLSFIFIMLAMFLVAISIKLVDWLGIVQYPVVKFGWEYHKTTYLLAGQALVYILNYFLLLPALKRLGIGSGFANMSISLLMMLLSVTLLETGAIFLGLAKYPMSFMIAVCIFTLGAALPTIIQAYVANLMDKSSLGKLLGFVSLASVGGKAVAAAIGPAILNAGIDSGNERLKGSIFFFAAIMILIAAFALTAVATRAGLLQRKTLEDDSGMRDVQ